MSQDASHAAKKRIRLVLAKMGLDGHDRGVKVVARALRDAGMEVVYMGLWQTAEAVVRTAVEEDAGFIGISILSGAHMTQVPLLLDELSRHEVKDIDVVVGGIIPQQDKDKLFGMGVAEVFGPGAPLTDIVEWVSHRWEEREGCGAGTG